MRDRRTVTKADPAPVPPAGNRSGHRPRPVFRVPSIEREDVLGAIIYEYPMCITLCPVALWWSKLPASGVGVAEDRTKAGAGAATVSHFTADPELCPHGAGRTFPHHRQGPRITHHDLPGDC